MSEIVGTNDVTNELGRNFIEYAVACNTDRAIPDAKSGLKPVAKRILWSSFEEGRVFSKPHVKAARIVGDVMGKYHPHGDSSIYGALVRLSQPWVLRYPLIDWHGSNGTIAGDGPAASRYTEARLSPIAEDGMLAGIKKKNVDFTSNYDETLDEPITLPTIFPNLLCNPNTGIGVALACNWLPHNLCEVAQAIYDYIDGNPVTLPGPDFPTGGVIINKNDIPAIMKTGHGSVKVRGRYEIDDNKIIFYEIPYGTTIEGILTNIGEVCDKKEIEGIIEIRDESNKKGIRIVIECGKGIPLEAIVNKLFAKTNLQNSISYNQVALVDKTPMELTLVDAIKIYLDHNKECLIKETNFDLKKAKDRLHIVEGLLIALEDIDNVIALIKSSESSVKAKEALMEKYNLSEIQAKAILDMRLAKLAKLEKIELENEKNNLLDDIADYETLLQDKNLQLAEVRRRLESLVKKYGDARRTGLEQIEIAKEDKAVSEVIPEDVVVVTTQSGLVKRVPLSNFKVQKKGGKGVKTNDDAILDVIKTNTADMFMIFTNKGKLYRTVVNNIPEGNNTSKGTYIADLIKIEPNEKVIAVTSLHKKSIPKYIIFITKKGMIKKSYLEEYMKVNRNTGIIATSINDGDEVLNILFQDDENLILVTEKGMSINFSTANISPVSRTAKGVKGIKLEDDDNVVAGMSLHKMTDCVAVFSSAGYGKKMNMKEFPTQTRGGKGTITYKGEGKIIGATMLSNEDNILLSGRRTSICISAIDVPLATKIAQGNIMSKNEIVSITKI